MDVAFADFVVLPPALPHGGHAAMCDQCRLGLAGRTGRVDGIGHVVRLGARGRVVRRAAFQIVAEFGEPGDLDVRRGDGVFKRTGSQDNLGAAIAEHERDPIGRQFGIDGNVHSAGLGHAQYRRDRLGRPLQAETHERTRLETLLNQPAGNPVGLRVQFAVVPRALAVDHGRLIRAQLRLSLEQLVQCLRLVRRTRFGQGFGHARPAPIGQQPVFLLLAEHGQCRDRLAGVLRYRCQQVDVVLQQHGDGLGNEQVRVVLHNQRDAAGRLRRDQ